MQLVILGAPETGSPAEEEAEDAVPAPAPGAPKSQQCAWALSAKNEQPSRQCSEEQEPAEEGQRDSAHLSAPSRGSSLESPAAALWTRTSTELHRAARDAGSQVAPARSLHSAMSSGPLTFAVGFKLKFNTRGLLSSGLDTGGGGVEAGWRECWVGLHVCVAQPAWLSRAGRAVVGEIAFKQTGWEGGFMGYGDCSAPLSVYLAVFLKTKSGPVVTAPSYGWPGGFWVTPAEAWPARRKGQGPPRESGRDSGPGPVRVPGSPSPGGAMLLRRRPSGSFSLGSERHEGLGRRGPGAH